MDKHVRIQLPQHNVVFYFIRKKWHPKLSQWKLILETLKKSITNHTAFFLMMLHPENSIWITELWRGLLLDLCVYHLNVLQVTISSVSLKMMLQNRICLCKHHLGMKKKMKPTSLFNHYIPSPLVYLSLTLTAVTPQNGKNLSVRKPFINHNFSDLNNFFL